MCGTIARPQPGRTWSPISPRWRRTIRAPAAATQATEAPLPGWRVERTECAWQNRLQVRRWSADASMLPGDCISPQARWWAWARGDQPLAWRTAWTARSLDDESGAEKRIVMMRRSAGGEWQATEWRWKPSPRAATRRWQEGRWKLLAALADGVNHAAAPAPGAAESALLRSRVGGEPRHASWRDRRRTVALDRRRLVPAQRSGRAGPAAVPPAVCGRRYPARAARGDAAAAGAALPESAVADAVPAGGRAGATPRAAPNFMPCGSRTAN